MAYPSAKVFTQPGCVPCHRAMEYLSKKGVEVIPRDIRADEDARQELAALGYRMTPVVLIGDTKIVGFNRAKIDEALAGFED